jgi:hypothetical protein
LKAFDIVDTQILKIAALNVIEYNQIPGEGDAILDQRLKALKKKLSEYSMAKKAEHKKGGHRK